MYLSIIRCRITTWSVGGGTVDQCLPVVHRATYAQHVSHRMHHWHVYKSLTIRRKLGAERVV